MFCQILTGHDTACSVAPSPAFLPGNLPLDAEISQLLQYRCISMLLILLLRSLCNNWVSIGHDRQRLKAKSIVELWNLLWILRPPPTPSSPLYTRGYEASSEGD